MIFKLYIMTLNQDYEPLGNEDEINQLYKNHDVEIVGEWLNVDNPRELYFITGYRDEEHYKSFVTAMNQNEVYKKVTLKIDEMRESVKAVTLKST